MPQSSKEAKRELWRRRATETWADPHHARCPLLVHQFPPVRTRPFFSGPVPSPRAVRTTMKPDHWPGTCVTEARAGAGTR